MLNWYETVFELIDMRSFSNLWYWIALAVVWSTSSHFVLGVPWDLVQRAKRHGGEAEIDLHDMVRVNVNRILYIADMSGLWLVGMSFFTLTSLLILGFFYGSEFSQALFLLAAPMTLVLGLGVRCARGIRAADGEGVYERISRQRFITQLIGMLSIFVTALWGMYQNMTIGVI